MQLAGIPVLDRHVLDITRRLREAGLDSTAETLELADAAKQRVAALTTEDREAVLRVLEDCPSELAELRSVLLREHKWRMREGL